jgi:hypothetical protein
VIEGTGNRVRVIIFMLKREELLEGWRNLKKKWNFRICKTLVLTAKEKRMSRADNMVHLEKNKQV